jgi:hypothetical protein
MLLGQNLLVKLMVAQPPKKLPSRYETLSFIIEFTTRKHVNEFAEAGPMKN